MNCKNCGAPVGENGVCMYCGTYYGTDFGNRKDTFVHTELKIDANGIYIRPILEGHEQYIHKSQFQGIPCVTFQP